MFRKLKDKLKDRKDDALESPTPYSFPKSPTHPCAAPTAPEPTISIPPNVLKPLQAFATSVLKRPCRKCSKNLLSSFSANNFMHTWSEAAASEQGASICIATCPSCSIATCLGCGKEPVYNKAKSVDEYFLRWCCTGGRIFGIWVLLSRFDAVELQVQSGGKASQVQQRNRRAIIEPNNGIGYALGNRPTGFIDYSDPRHALRLRLAQALDFKQQDDKTDYVTYLILSLVTILLPSAKNVDGSEDLAAVLQVSLILDKVAELLRNDSLDNVTKRYKVYHAALSFTAKLAKHPKLGYLVQDERFSKQKTAGLQAVSECGINGQRSSEMLVLGKDTAGSISKGMANLSQQANVLLQTRKNVKGFDDDTGRTMLAICEEIYDLYCDLGATVMTLPSRTKAVKTAEDQWALYHQENCLRIDDAALTILENHARDPEYRITQSIPGRMKRLVTETANMSTSLPLGVFVKVGESRLDCMKALIIGPKDTPYAYGLFEFEIFCPTEYPRVAPKVTALCGRTFNINPNIHPDGKVCLSLLGTWPEGDQAAQWQPGVSTILQVLVTIQSMLFTEDPWRNEPGAEGDMGPKALREAQEYIRRRQPMTVWYLIQYMKGLGDGNGGIWDEVVNAHFRINEGKILDKVEEWRKVNPEICQWSGWRGSARKRMPGWHNPIDLLSLLKDGFKWLEEGNEKNGGMGRRRFGS